VALSASFPGSAQYFSMPWAGMDARIAASKRRGPVDIIANVVEWPAVWIATAPDFKFSIIKDVKGQKVSPGMPTYHTSLFMKLA